MKVINLPPVLRLKSLAKALKMTPADVAKMLPEVRKAGGRFECMLNGATHYFLTLAEIVVPFEEAKAIILKKRKQLNHHMQVNLLEPEYIIQENLITSFNSKERFNMSPTSGEEIHGSSILDYHEQQTGVVVLLGHFDHGKTTLLDALSSPYQPPTIEPCGITQNVRTRGVDLQRWLRKHDSMTPLLLPREQELLSNLPSPSTSKDDEISCHKSNDESAALTSYIDSISSITQSSPWYSVVTFVDTPGQELFHRLRTNGALCGDVVVLVVDVSEGVGKQTEESIGCAEELGLPVIVALNKCDLVDEQTLQKVEDDLREYLVLQNSAMFPISAKLHQGLPSFALGLVRQFHPQLESEKGKEEEEEEMNGNCSSAIDVLEDSDDKELNSNSKSRGRRRRRNRIVEEQEQEVAAVSDSIKQWWGCSGSGVVLDAMMRKGQGACLHVLMQKGTLKVGDVFVAGLSRFRVRQILPPENGDIYRAQFLANISSWDEDNVILNKSSSLSTVTGGEEITSSSSPENSPKSKKKTKSKKKMKKELENQLANSNTSSTTTISSVEDHQTSQELSSYPLSSVCLKRGEAAHLLVNVLAPIPTSVLDLDGELKLKGKQTKFRAPASSLGKGGGSAFRYSPVGEELLVLGSDQAQMLQDLRHCQSLLMQAEAAGVALLDKRREDEEIDEDEYYDDVEDEDEDEDENDYEDENDDDNNLASVSQSVNTFRETNQNHRRRFVVIKTGSAASLATILDAIHETQEKRCLSNENHELMNSSNTHLSHTSSPETSKGQMSSSSSMGDGSYDFIEVVLGDVGPVSLSDINIAMSAGVRTILTYGMEYNGNHSDGNSTGFQNNTAVSYNKKDGAVGQISLKKKSSINKKNKKGGGQQHFKSLVEFARHQKIEIIKFDSIQSLIDEAFVPSSGGGGQTFVK